METTGATWSGAAIEELRAAAANIPDATLDRFVDEVLAAKRVSCFAWGRENLMLRAFLMRLVHLGKDAHFAGDTTSLPIGPGDLFLVVCGPGRLVSSNAMIEIAKDAGARVLVVTAQPEGETSRKADVLIHLPAQTLADDQGPASASVLPMGTLFEILELLFFDIAAIRLRERSGQTLEQIRARHTNLE